MSIRCSITELNVKVGTVIWHALLSVVFSSKSFFLQNIFQDYSQSVKHV